MFTLGPKFVHTAPPPRESQPPLTLRAASMAETDAARPRRTVRLMSCILNFFYEIDSGNREV